MLNSFRTPSEFVHIPFITHSGIHSELIQNSFRTHWEFMQESFRTHSEFIQMNQCRSHSELMQESFNLGWILGNLKWIWDGSGIHLGWIWREFSQDEFIGLRIHQVRSRRTNSSSEISQDEFIGLRIHQVRSRRTNSSGYEFIKWDLAGRIHQLRIDEIKGKTGSDASGGRPQQHSHDPTADAFPLKAH